MRSRVLVGGFIFIVIGGAVLGTHETWAIQAAELALGTPEERAKAFEWFGTLGFPDVKDAEFVRIATGLWSETNDGAPENAYWHGFLLSDAGDAFTVFTPNLATTTFKRRRDSTPEYARVAYEDADLAQFAEGALKALRASDSEDDDPWRRVGERLTERSETFVLAWACSRNGKDLLAADLFDQADRIVQEYSVEQDRGLSLQQRVAADIARAEMWRAVVDFGEPHVSREQLLQRFQWLVKNFPDSEHAGRAKATMTTLTAMVREDQEHAEQRRAGKPFDELSRDEQIAELIFQLRDQNGQQWTQPGECDIFSDILGGRNTPAHKLVELGYDAVPQLIEALGDDRFTRSVGFHRNFYFSHHVLTVGDCAERILVRIARMPFYEQTYTGDKRVPALQKAVQAWYAGLKRHGER